MEINAPDRALTIWTVTDGRAGNRVQALGLAEAMQRRRPTRIDEIEAVPKRAFAAMPSRLWRMIRLPGWPQWGYRDLVLPDDKPDLIIGGGRRAAPLVAALGDRCRCPTVQLLDPQMPPSAFTLVVAPAHDRLDAPNTLSTVGSIGRLTPERITQAAKKLPETCSRLPRPRLAVLLGGPSGSARWTESDSRALQKTLERLSRGGQSLMITPSRRTPAEVGLRAAELCSHESHIFAWDGEGKNPYPGILALADAILVTEDSVNMASEAASTGKPVHLFPLSRVSGKIRRFHDQLIAHGAARRFAGGIGQWTYQPLAEADRIAAEIDVRLFED